MYSFVMCNLDMADTLPTSALSLITQLRDNCEVIIVDGGSSDGSFEIAENLCQKFDSVRAVKSPYENLGKDRNYGTRLADGDVVIHQFDCDDMLFEDSVDRLLDRIGQIKEEKWFLRSGTFNVAPKSVLLDTGYGHTSRAEDKKLWRIIESKNDIEFISESKDYAKTLKQDSKLDKIRKDILGTRGDLRNGVDKSTLINNILSNEHFSFISKPFRIANLLYQDLVWKTDSLKRSLNRKRLARRRRRQERYGLPSNLDSVHMKEERKSQTDAHIARDMEAML